MQKHRVSRACDTCKRRKIRCTGKLPCAHCIKNNKSCEFTAAYTRGALPEVQSAPVEEQERYLEEVGYKRRQIWRNSSSVKTTSHVSHTEPNNSSEKQRDKHKNNSPKSDPSSLYQSNGSAYQRITSVNNLTAVCLYEQTHNHLNKQSSNQKNPVYAYGDPSLPEIDSSFLLIPSEKKARALVSKYFDFVAATNRFLHRPTVDMWTSQLLDNFRTMSPRLEENSQRAVVLMVFASAHEYMDEDHYESNVDTSFYYFNAAENQLTKETGEIRLATLQARLLQCMYLLSRSRINQCYSIFGILVNYVYSLGINRHGRFVEKIDLLDDELRKRVLWSVYVADKYLSSALGRPQMLRDEDIDQPLPLLVEDENLSSESLQTMGLDTQTPVKGAVFQIKLAQIISGALKELYGIRKNSLEAQFASVERLSIDLTKWRNEVAHFVDLDPSLLLPMYGRQNMALRLSYWQALVILYRPFLVDTSDAETSFSVPVMKEKLEEKINECLTAALNAVKIIDTMYELETSFNASWFAHFCGYTATVPLFVHIIKRCNVVQARQSEPNPHAENLFSSLKIYFDAAAKCQEQIKNSSIKTKESFAQKCSIVLADLRAEAAVKMKKLQNKSSNRQNQSEITEQPEVRQVTELLGNEATQMQMEDSDLFLGEWNDLNFETVAIESNGVYSLFNGLDGYRDGSTSRSLVDRIDRWGFSSLTGY